MAPSTSADVRFLTLVLIVFCLLFAALFAIQAWQSGLIQFYTTETISGRVVYEGDAPLPEKMMVVADVAACGKVDHYDNRLQIGANGGIENAVVSLARVEGGKSLEALGSEFVLDQQICTYLPHVLLAPIDAPVQILNSDDIFHNIHTFSSKNAPVNLAQPPTVKKLEKTFSVAEKIQVRCDIHGWMSAWIVAVDHPYHAVTDAEGRFVLTDIPPGTYTVHCWQELLGEQSVEVTVAEDAHIALDFTFSGAE